MKRGARAASFACVFWVAGCATPGPQLGWPAQIDPAMVELEATPFFPQRDYQCGPAALATVLTASGVAVTPDELVAAVYLPARRGSLQSEIVAATRARGRLPYLLPPQETALLAELSAGHPVLVLQKLGAGPWPGWHYAVLVGYDRARETVLLRSGTDRRLEMSARRFLWTWDRAGRWAMLALAPGEMPALADISRYLDASAALEAVGRLEDAALSYAAAARRWPDAALPWLGLGNLAYARDDLLTAKRLYGEALTRDPEDVAARNNRAETLLRLGCVSAATREIEQARASARGGALEVAVEETARRIAAAATTDATDCPVAE